MRKLTALLGVLLTGLVVFCQDDAAKLDELVGAYAKQYKFNGSVLVAKGGKVILEKGYGYRNAKDSLLNDGQTIFQIGSITKQFTATVILKLQEQKKLSVKDKLSKYYPDFPKGDSITIEHLLTHTSGIFNYTNDGKFMSMDAIKPANEEKILALFKSKPLDFSPGTKWSYSNSGYSLLGYIIQKVTKKPYEQVVREFIFHPLQMIHSGFDFTHLTDKNRATGYFTYSEKVKAPSTIVDSSVAFSAGAIYTTVEDLYKWHKGMQQNKIINAASTKSAYTPFLNNYGYGLGIDSMYGKRIIAHGGGIFGFNTNIARIVEDDICIVLLNNTGNPFLGEINNNILAELYGKPYELPMEKKVVKVDPAKLTAYVGEYELAPTFIITVTLENDELKAQPTGQPKFDLSATSDTTFFVKAVDADLSFVKDASGKVEKLILKQGGKETAGKKIK